MGVIDDCKFMVTSLTAKVKRIATVAEECEATPSEKKKRLLVVMSEMLDEVYDTFHDNIIKIAAYNGKNNIEEDLDVKYVQTFDNAYFKSKAVLLSVTDGQRGTASESLVEMSVPGQSHSNSHIQLPKLKLPEFGGAIKEWQSFSDMFRTTVHINTSLSDVQRHAYLRSALSGEALALVASLPLTGPNYAVCWDTLARQYDDTHLQTNAHLEVLFSLTTTSANPVDVRTVACKLAECVGALTALGHEVEGWAVPLLFVFTKRLHSRMREAWEERVLLEPLPSVKSFIGFLHEHARVLEAACSAVDAPTPKKSTNKTPPIISSSSANRSVTSLAVSAPAGGGCLRCEAQHELFACGQFRQDSVRDRIDFVKSHKLWLACLSPGHFVGSCQRETPCKHCSFRHHSILHLWPQSGQGLASGSHRSDPPQTPPVIPVSSPDPPVDTLQIYVAQKKGPVVVATAVAKVQDERGRHQDARLLIDPGSQATFITRSCAARLGLTALPTEVPVLVMGQTSLIVCHKMVECRFKPKRSVNLRVTALDFKTRTPSSPLPFLPPERLVGKKLADPSYFRPADVDILLGAEWFGCVMVGEPQRGPPGTPSLLKSIWGFCLIGRISQATASVRSLCVLKADDTCAILHRFWEIEEPPPLTIVSHEDRACEEIYIRTLDRHSDGRYIVSLPFRPDCERLSDSRQAALRRFPQMERRLNQSRALRTSYCEFMRDYRQQGYMGWYPRLRCSISSLTIAFFEQMPMVR